MEEKRQATIYELNRMKKAVCPAHHNCGECSVIQCTVSPSATQEQLDKLNAAVLQWVDEHPQKTYAQDFFSKYPKAPHSKEYPDFPLACRSQIYGCFRCEGITCADCWNEVMPDDTETS
jgi:hypothetical protein